MKIRSTVTLVMILGVFASLIYSAPTGKISGLITDAETGQPLQGVNVMVEGTVLGAATGAEGYYVILNVPPDVYTLRATMIGYADYIIQNVKVGINLTTTISIQLQTRTVAGEEVIVVAERPIIVPEVSSSQMNISEGEIVNLPVKTVGDIIGLQAGILGQSVRGGDPDEIAFMIDDFKLMDERVNLAYTGISLSSIKEIQIETGGFNAEFGNVRSGVINVVTKEGSSQKYSGVVTTRYSPPAPKHFGGSLYSPDTYWNRPYLDPEVCYIGTREGWDDYTQAQNRRFDGWNAVSRETMLDGDPTNDLTPEGARRVYEWEHRRVGDIVKPDYTVDFGLGGPVPFLSERLGNLRFYLSYRQEQELFMAPRIRDGYRDYNAQLKITSDISSTMKLMITGMYGVIRSVRSGGVNTGSVSRGGTVGGSSLYLPIASTPTDIYRNMEGIEFTHQLDNRTFYELRFQKLTNIYNTDTTAHRNRAKIYEPVPGYFVDENPYGWWGYTTLTLGDWMTTGGRLQTIHDKSRNSTYTLEGNYTTQFDRFNQIKTGFVFTLNDFKIDTWRYNPQWVYTNYYMKYTRKPYRLGFYVQDKLEFEDFIVNMGLRLDHSNPNGTWYEVTDYSPEYLGEGSDPIEEAPREKAKGQLALSPRLGISYPITVNSKLYFNYGHFYQEASSYQRFQVYQEDNGAMTYLGNPELELAKTIAYELGFEQSMFQQYLFKVAAFYKNINDQPSWTVYESVNAATHVRKATSDSYEDIRGVEFTMRKRIGDWITGFVNYTYNIQTSGYFGYTYYYEDPVKMREFIRSNPYQERPHPRPFFRASIDLHAPSDFGPSVMGFRPLGAWRMNLLYNWRTGSFFTWNPESKPWVIDNVQWVDTYDFDMRFSRNINLNRFNLELFVDVSNVLNFKFLSSSGFSDSYDREFYYESLCFDWEEGEFQGNDRVGIYRDWDVEYDPLQSLVDNPDNDAEIAATNEEIRQRNEERRETKSYIEMPNIRELTFLNPRDITIGVRISF